jgi:hypothetical protein
MQWNCASPHHGQCVVRGAATDERALLLLIGTKYIHLSCNQRAVISMDLMDSRLDRVPTRTKCQQIRLDRCSVQELLAPKIKRENTGLAAVEQLTGSTCALEVIARIVQQFELSAIRLEPKI